MVARHDASKQKKAAKHKAKRSEKRAKERRRDSRDPTVRLQGAEKWPIVQTLAAAKLWTDGIGYLAIARQEAEGRLVYSVFLVDVYCLGVKNALWGAGSPEDFKELIQKLEKIQAMVRVSPAALVKTIEGAVDYAGSFGFPPHSDYRHAAKLLAGIDAAGCDQELTFGRDGKPFYIQGPYESPGVAEAILQRVKEAGGTFIAKVYDPEAEEFDESEFDHSQFDSIEEDGSPG